MTMLMMLVVCSLLLSLMLRPLMLNGAIDAYAHSAAVCDDSQVLTGALDDDVVHAKLILVKIVNCGNPYSYNINICKISQS